MMFDTDQLIQTINYWIQCLEDYTNEQFVTSPGPGHWSIGQLYLHLILDSTFYIEQARQALATDDHSGERAKPRAKKMLLENEFPDMRITGDPSHAYIPQPKHKQELANRLVQLQHDISQVSLWQNKKPPVGKSKHPGLGYFDTNEWLQLADMHFRHHLKQKKRIDTFLQNIQEA